MKKIVIGFITVLFFCSCSNITSRTIIRPKKIFELGEGRHRNYEVLIINDCAVPIDVYEATLDSTEIFLLTLEPVQRQTLKVGNDKKLLFKNNSSTEAAIKLKLTGNPGSLSMGGHNY